MLLRAEVDFDGECALDCEPASSELDLFIPDKEDGLQEVSPFLAFKSFEEDPLYPCFLLNNASSLISTT